MDTNNSENGHEINMINVHTHLFTLKYVNWRIKMLSFLIPVIKPIIEILRIRNNWIDRQIRLVEIGKKETQEEVFEILRAHYPSETKFVVLSLDMKFMNSIRPSVNFKGQLKELDELQNKYRDSLLPFISVDPRREDIFKLVKKYIGRHKFTGIKLYPSHGYFPFPFPYGFNGVRKGEHCEPLAGEENLGEIFDYAQERGIPVMTHCTPGGVPGWEKKYSKHPVTGHKIKQTHRGQAHHLGHPKNYYYLLEQFPKLKLCLAHFGGHDDWERYLGEPLEQSDSDTLSKVGLDKITEERDRGTKVDPVWNPLKQEVVENAWVRVIRDLLKDDRYPNVYADISFNAYSPDALAYLKALLSDPKIRSKVLFGSDFYVVRRVRSEKQFSINMRSYLGEDLFHQIAVVNPRAYLW